MLSKTQRDGATLLLRYGRTDRSNCQRARRRRGNVNMDFPTDSRSRRQFRQMTTAQDERGRLECMVDGRYWSESLNLKSNIHSNDDACSLGRTSSKCTSFRSSQSKEMKSPAKESAIWRSFRGQCRRRNKFGDVLRAVDAEIVIARTSADRRLSNQSNWHSEMK